MATIFTQLSPEHRRKLEQIAVAVHLKKGRLLPRQKIVGVTHAL
ncbi:MAG: hypothetical protein ACLP2P_04540 [Desulfobaccales bacterium]